MLCRERRFARLCTPSLRRSNMEGIQRRKKKEDDSVNGLGQMLGRRKQLFSVINQWDRGRQIEGSSRLHHHLLEARQRLRVSVLVSMTGPPHDALHLKLRSSSVQLGPDPLDPSEHPACLIALDELSNRPICTSQDFSRSRSFLSSS